MVIEYRLHDCVFKGVYPSKETKFCNKIGIPGNFKWQERYIGWMLITMKKKVISEWSVYH